MWVASDGALAVYMLLWMSSSDSSSLLGTGYIVILDVPELFQTVQQRLCLIDATLTYATLTMLCRDEDAARTGTGPGAFAAGHTPHMLSFFTPSPQGAAAAGPPPVPQKGKLHVFLFLLCHVLVQPAWFLSRHLCQLQGSALPLRCIQDCWFANVVACCLAAGGLFPGFPEPPAGNRTPTLGKHKQPVGAGLGPTPAAGAPSGRGRKASKAAGRLFSADGSATPR